MANSPQATKRARQADKRNLHNADLRSKFRTVIKNTLKLLEAKDKTGATEAFKTAIPQIDRMVHNKLIHANRAARLKSRINKKLKQA